MSYNEFTGNTASRAAVSNRHSALRLGALFFVALLFAGLVASLAQLPSVRAQPQFLGGIKRLQPATYHGSDRAAAIVNSRKASAVSLAAGDFDVDGYGDLAVGLSAPHGGIIAFHLGDRNAFAPQDQATLDAIGRGDFPSPYLPDAQLVEIPERPDFLGAGDFIGAAGPGVVAAARNGQSLYVVARGASGLLDLEQTIQVPGQITALASHGLRATKYENVVVGIHNDQGSQLLLYTGSADGLTLEASFALDHDATAFAFGKMDADPVSSVLVIAGGQPSILHTGRQTVEPLTLPFHVVAAELGHFLPDRVSLHQIALLSDDGTLHIWAHSNINTTPVTAAELAGRSRMRDAHGSKPIVQPAFMRQPIVWKEMESVPNAGPAGSAGRAPIMFRTRVSNSPMDDVLFMGSTKLSVVAHAFQAAPAAVQTDRWDLASDAVAAIPTRTNIDGRLGVVFVRRGGLTPEVLNPATNATYTVNRSDDPPASSGSISSYCLGGNNDCSLRQAILKANADSGTDLVMLGSRTITLSIARNGSDDGTNGTLQVFANMDIVGAGTNNTIVQAGTLSGPSCDGNIRSGCGVDLVMAVNEDVNSYTNATASLSNFTIQNGFNRGDIDNKEDGFGGGLDFDTGASGTNTLTVTNVNLANNSASIGSAFNAFNFQGGTQNDPNGPSTVTFSNVVVQSNAAYPTGADGTDEGGVTTDQQSRMVITNCDVTNNTATADVSGIGAGLWLDGGVNTASYQIHASTVRNNTSSESGGGMVVGGNLVLDAGSSFKGNSQTSGGGQGGGAIFIQNAAPDSVSISNVNFDSNSAATKGGAIFSDTPAGMSVQFSRFHGNTASGGGSAFWNNGGTATLNDNWWGTNTAGAVMAQLGSCSNCNPAASFSLSRFLELSVTTSASTVAIGGANSATVTASFLTDSANNAISPANLEALAGVPVAFGGASHGTLSTANTVIGASVAIASVTESGNTVNVTTSAAHGFMNGQLVYISGVGSGYDGQYTVANASGNTFTYMSAASDLPNVSASGTASVPSGTGTTTYTGTHLGVDTLQATVDGLTVNAASITVNSDTTTTSQSPNAVTFSESNQNVSLSATVSASSGDTVSVGTVTFTVVNGGGTQVGSTATSGTVSNGAASATYSLPANVHPGTYPIHSAYSGGSPGSGNFASSSDTSSNHVITVNAASTSTAGQDASANFSSASQNVTLSATVTSGAGAVNEGTVTFQLLNGSTPVGNSVTSSTVNNNAASASYSVPGGTTGSLIIQATYNPGQDFTGSSDSSHHLTISGASTNTAASNATATFSTSSQPVNLTASVTSAGGTVNSGTVTFTVFNGGSQVGSPTSPATVTNNSASATYTLPGGTNAGTYTIVASYTGAGGFTNSSDNTHTLVVRKGTPVLSWSNPANITFGGALSASQLNASANVPGTFIYTPPAGTVLPVGNNQTLSVQFTPTDTTDYNGASTSVAINVLPGGGPATLVVTETLARDSGAGNVIVTVTVANTGGSPATNLLLTSAKIGAAAPLTSLPLAVPDVPGGGSSAVTLTFPSSVGASGTRAVLSLSGTYSGGGFGGSARISLP